MRDLTYRSLKIGEVVYDRGCRLKLKAKQREENGPEHVIDTYTFKILCADGEETDAHWHGMDREIRRQINDFPSPWEWQAYDFDNEPRFWYARYRDYVDNDHRVDQIGPREYRVSLGRGSTVTCRSQTEIEAALSKYRDEDD